MGKKRKKILFFLPSNTGGAERMTVTIAKILPKEDFEVKFVIVDRNLGTIVNFIPKTYDIIHIPIHNLYCATTARMYRIIRKEAPYAVFSSLLYLNARLIVAAKACKVKVVVRNNIEIRKTTSIQSPFLIKATYKWADKIIAQQEEMRHEIIKFTGVTDSKIITLHNPLDIESIELKRYAKNPYNNDNASTRYVWTARFAKEKGQDLLVKAFHIVKKKDNNAHLYLVGRYDWNRSFDKSVKQYVDDCDLSDSVHFIGFDNNPYKWIQNADCFVLPSRLEGLPNSLIDAMYIGKPVVATRCLKVIDRIVKDDYNGYIVSPENIEELATAMQKAPLLNNFSMIYKPATSKDFIKIFNEL